MLQKDSLTFPEADPWASPEVHRGHNHTSSPPITNGVSRESNFNGSREPVRTTSNITTGSNLGSNGTSAQSSENSQSGPASGVWGSYEEPSSSSFINPPGATIGSGGFGDTGGGGGSGERPAHNPPNRFFGGGRVTLGGLGETIVVTLLPEKEGMFMFQHHNYQVASVRKGIKVVRRYSDFVWLLDCLQKRFPFRQLPLLPPKRVGGEHYPYFYSLPSYYLAQSMNERLLSKF